MPNTKLDIGIAGFTRGRFLSFHSDCYKDHYHENKEKVLFTVLLLWRHHSQGNSYTQSIELGICLQFHRFSPLSWQGALWHSGMCCSSTWELHLDPEETGLGMSFWNLKGHRQWLTSSNKTIPSNPSQIMPLWGDWASKNISYGDHSHSDHHRS